MKLSKNLGRIATTFLATAMLAGLTAVPASAAAVTGGVIGTGNGDAITDFTMPVEIKKPNMVITPDVTLNVAVTGVAPSTDTETVEGKKAGETVTLNVHSGVDTGTITVKAEDSQTPNGNVTFSSASGVGGSDATVGSDTISKNVTFDLSGLSFNDAGVYKYTIATTASTKPGEFTLAENMSLYLFVENDGDYKVTGVVVKDADGVKASTLTNYYMLDPDQPDDPSQKVANLTVTNAVEGSMGNRDEEFTYTLEVPAGKTFAYVKNGTETGTLTNSNNTFKLKNDDLIVIYGLEKTSSYKLNEDGAQMGYTVTCTGGDYTTQDGVSISMANGDKNVTFTNTRNAIAPTGLVMNVAPYVLLVLVAAGAGYVFLRKREED